MIFEPFEQVTCVITHPQMQGVFYCEDSAQGLTRDLNLATKYMGAQSRARGLENMLERYPKMELGQVMFFYLTE